MNFLSTYSKVTVVLLLILVSCKPAEITQEEPDSGNLINAKQEVLHLIRNMPAEQSEEEVWVNEQLVELGADAVTILSGMLMDPAMGSDLQARYAFSSLANYVARPGAESQKTAFEHAVLKELQKDHSTEVKSFLMEQLRLTASDRSIPVLTEYLTHENLYNDALKVLLTIHSSAAAKSIQQVVSVSDGDQQIAMIKALGELRDKNSIPLIQEYATSDQWPVTRMSLYALSEIGEPGASSLYRQSIEGQQGFRRSEVVSFYLSYAESLQKNGYATDSEEITRYVLNGDFPAHTKSSSLHILFALNGNEMSEELIEMAQQSEAILAKTALRLLNTLEGKETTIDLMEGIEGASSANNTIYFIETLGERRDDNAVPFLKEQSQNSNGEVRLAALQALYQFEDGGDPELSIDLLEKSESDPQREVIKQLMRQLNPETVVPAVVKAYPDVSPQTKVSLISILEYFKTADGKEMILEDLNSENPEVRIAVINYLKIVGDETDSDLLLQRLEVLQSDSEQEALQEALASILNRSMTDAQRKQQFYNDYENGSIRQKVGLINVAPRLEGIDHREFLENALQHSNTEIRTTSAQVISQWNNPDMIPLSSLALSELPAENQSDLFVTFTQEIRRADMNLSEKEPYIHQLVTGIRGNDHKIELLNQIAESHDLLALQTVAQYLSHESEEIREASIHILANMLQSHYIEGSEELDLANGILAVLDEETRETITDQLRTRAADRDVNRDGMEDQEEPGFGSIFNGRDLDGWQVIGSQEAWGAEDGILFTDGAGSGWISTVSQYDNFLIELEYRVPEGGNSGLFIRAPHEGNPAHRGLEIQILDDYADRYADLKPWQYTGSIYFQQAVSKRVTKPAGEWQSMKVRAEGPNIQVTVNGEMVINANLIEYMDNASDHPGLLRRSGYIGLQNHGEKVEFRNIEITKIN